MSPEESAPWLVPMPAGAKMVFWVIWDHPEDAPHAWVLRPQYVMQNDYKIAVSHLRWFAKTVDELRAILPPGLYCQPRQDGDPPHLFETWF